MPTVTFVSTPFQSLSLRRRESLGIDAPMLWVPHPMMTLNQDEIEALADKIMPAVIGTLVSQGKPALE